MSLQERPACRDQDPELFFPVSEEATHQIARAKSVCRLCPVMGSCLQYAMQAGEDYGIWGATTAEERRRTRQQRRAGAGRGGTREVPAA